MNFGLCQLPTDESAPVPLVARLAEERGFESLLFAEHTHIPASRLSPYPGGGELPRRYIRTLDPFASLGAAAAATERIRIGTGICLLIQRDPITTAKEVATIDRLCGGRFLFGIGAGWNLEEMQNHGTDPAARFSVLRERVEAMRELWTTEEASYHGRYVNFDRVWSYPKPVQQPHPPVLIGGNGSRVLERVLDFGDGWLPNARSEPEQLLERIAELRRRAADRDREVSCSLFGAPLDPALLERFRNAGLERCLFWAPSKPRPEVERRLDELAGAISELERAGA